MTRRLHLPPVSREEARRITQLGAALLRGERPETTEAADDEGDVFGLMEDLCGYRPAPCGDCGDFGHPDEMDEGLCWECRPSEYWDDEDRDDDLPF